MGAATRRVGNQFSQQWCLVERLVAWLQSDRLTAWQGAFRILGLEWHPDRALELLRQSGN
ncbi:MAG: hypothetical protein KME27_00370 [Lyngbya sp. HA4199-MV5]|nr:hypothetical protein [Lyngbya sp. HA4199-MV5]